MTKYHEFVREHMKNRGQGVCPKEHMKEIAKKWRLQKEDDEGEGVIPFKDGIYLKLSQEAYDPKADRKEEITASGETFTYDPSISTTRVAVYHSPTRLIVAQRGTVPSDPKDLYADLHIAATTFEHTARAKSALTNAKKAHKKYPHLVMSSTGHSLGGAAALYVAKKMDVKNSKVVVFNPGSSPAPLLFDIWTQGLKKALATRVVGKVVGWAKCKINPKNEQCVRKKNTTMYATPVDPIAFGHIDNATLIKPEQMNFHGMENYIIGEEEKKEGGSLIDSSDTVSVDIPLLIRLMEYAREDAKTDMDLHVVAENAISLNKTLTMKEYKKLIPTKKKSNN